MTKQTLNFIQTKWIRFNNKDKDNKDPNKDTVSRRSNLDTWEGGELKLLSLPKMYQLQPKTTWYKDFRSEPIV